MLFFIVLHNMSDNFKIEESFKNQSACKTKRICNFASFTKVCKIFERKYNDFDFSDSV